MEGPYEWVPPNYWLEDTARGGAFGFATEICPGPAVPPIESLPDEGGECIVQSLIGPLGASVHGLRS